MSLSPDDGLLQASALSRVMSTSHSNGRRAVEEESNAASRGFRQVAGEASRDIQVRRDMGSSVVVELAAFRMSSRRISVAKES